MQDRYRNALSSAITSHCHRRMSQRGIRPEIVDLVFRYGREQYIRGALVYFVGTREVALHARHGIDLSACLNVHVVCASDASVVITTYTHAKRVRHRAQHHRNVPRRSSAPRLDEAIPTSSASTTYSGYTMPIVSDDEAVDASTYERRAA